METRPMCSDIEKIGKFSDWLKSQLESRNMSISRLAKISGVHPNTIRNYLSLRCEPTLYNVICLTHALGYDLGVIRR